MTSKETLTLILAACEGRLQDAEIRDAEIRLCLQRIDILTGALRNVVDLVGVTCGDEDVRKHLDELSSLLKDDKSGQDMNRLLNGADFQRDQARAEIQRISAMIEGLPDDD